MIDANGMALMAPDGGDYRRRLFTCDGENSHLTIKGVILHNATTWTCVPENADSVLVKNIKVINHFDQDRVKIQNDGINLYSCTNSVVDQCFVITGDDAFCAKQGNAGKPGTRLTFKNSVLFTRCAGNKVGMQSRSRADDIWFINNTIVSCRRGIVIEMDSGSEGSANIHFVDVTVEKFYLPKGLATMRPIHFFAEKAPVNNVEVTNVTFLDDPKSKKNVIEGFEPGISNVTFKNLRFEKEVITSLDQGKIKTSGMTSEITFEK
jgi:polygalacturonase